MKLKNKHKMNQILLKNVLPKQNKMNNNKMRQKTRQKYQIVMNNWMPTVNLIFYIKLLEDSSSDSAPK